MVREKLIKSLQGATGLDKEVIVEHPEFTKFGDYSTNAAMILASKVKKPPMEVAQAVISKLPELDFLEKTTAVQPGFINFYLKQEFLIKELNNVLGLTEQFGSSEIGKGKKVVLEHTDVNPNKALHIGHLQNACLGSSVEKILEFLGYDVEVQYYVDDTGVQVATTVLGLRELDVKPERGEKFDHYASRVYVAVMEALESNLELKKKLDEIVHSLDKQEGELKNYAKDFAVKVLGENLKTTNEFGIDYDLLVWESDILASGFWEKAFSILKESKGFEKCESGDYDGCWVIKNVMGGDKVIVKSNGIVTYTGKDIAYHLWKYNLLGKDFLYKKWEKAPQRKDLWSTSQDGGASGQFGHADIVVNFIDVRQSFPQQAVKDSLKTLGFSKQAENMHHIGHGFVSLSPKTAKGLGVEPSESKRQYAMSGRKGIVVMADNLLDLVAQKVAINHPDSPTPREIAVGAIKYYLLSYNPLSDVVFDYEKALDIYGNSGPYLQYTYARAMSVLDKAGETDFDKSPQYKKLNEEELEVLRMLYRFPEVVTGAGSQFAPYVICNFLFELAQSFNTFYNQHRVIGAPEGKEAEAFRLALTQGVAYVLRNGLRLLGIAAPERV